MPPSMSQTIDSALAERAYSRLVVVPGFHVPKGAAMPPWDQLDPPTKNNWVLIAKAMRQEIERELGL